MSSARFLPWTIGMLSLLCHGSQSRAAEATGASSEQKILNRELGEWSHTCTQLKAEWTPQETKSAVIGSYRRILGGRFVQGKLKASDGQTALQLDTYDVERKHYRRWPFHSNGQTSEHIGKWNPDAKSMTWTGSVGGGLKSTQVDRYIGADTLATTLLIKDADGKVYYHLTSKSVRTQ